MASHGSGLPSGHKGLRALACGLVLLFLTGAWSAVASAQGGTTYVVQPGDSLGYIAASYGTSVQAIMDANGLASPDTIWVGQSLTIPIQSSSTPAAGGGTGNVYTVQLGDTLNSIAATLGVDRSALAQANNLTNPDQLWIGQPLLVPGRSLGSSAVALAPAPAPAAGRYIVQPGDTLNGIAAQLGVTASALLGANNLTNADLLRVGQTLMVPGAGQAGPALAAIATPKPQPSTTSTATPGAPGGDLGVAGPDAPPTDTPTPSGSLPTDTPVPAGSLAADTPASSGSLPGFYVVQPGDTLSRIAARLGVSAGDLLHANNLANPDRLSPGQKLAVPGAPTQAPSPTSTPTDTADASAAPQAGPPTPGLAPGLMAAPTPLPGPDHYTVQPGDTLGIIAKQFGTTAAAIARANKIISLDMLSVGTDLLIPAPDWTSPAIGDKPSRFVASISQQHCWLYQGNVVVASWTCSTGRPGAASRPGSYKIQSKMPKAFGSTWNIWMPYWLGIYWAGASENGIHGIPTKADSKEVLWDGLVGTPITFGCIMLDQDHAKQLYDLAYIGMPVIIQR